MIQDPPSKKILPWKVLSSKELFRAGFFVLRTDRCELPDARVMPNYYVFDFKDWVNVIALTKQNEVILVEQYRHAVEEVALEIPGGSSDPMDLKDYQKAAERELLEETGYRPKKCIYLGKHRPNPAMQNNWMHSFLALDCEKVADQNLDAFEDILVLKVPVREVYDMVFQAKINHSIVVASMMLAYPHLKSLIEK